MFNALRLYNNAYTEISLCCFHFQTRENLPRWAASATAAAVAAVAAAAAMNNSTRTMSYIVQFSLQNFLALTFPFIFTFFCCFNNIHFVCVFSPPFLLKRLYEKSLSIVHCATLSIISLTLTLNHTCCLNIKLRKHYIFEQ